MRAGMFSGAIAGVVGFLISAPTSTLYSIVRRASTHRHHRGLAGPAQPFAMVGISPCWPNPQEGRGHLSTDDGYRVPLRRHHGVSLCWGEFFINYKLVFTARGAPQEWRNDLSAPA